MAGETHSRLELGDLHHSVGADGMTVSTVVPSTQGRLDRLRNIMAEREIQCLLISDPANIRYLSGFSGSAALMLVTGDRALITTDSRYAVQIEEEADLAGVSGSMDIVVSGPSNQDGQKEAIVDMVGSSAMGRLALEADRISWQDKKRWQEAFQDAKVDIEFQPVTGLVEQLRTVKDGMEISLMQHAAAIADVALGKVFPMLEERPQEKDFALELDWWMRKLGADDRAFETIVAAGPNGAKPHAQPSSRPIEYEDAVVVDFGASFMGYCSDTTRTLCGAGKLSGEMAGVYGIVARSQQAGIDTLRAGVKCSDVDRACREVIEDAGYGDKFAHSTGHGVGLYVHESPVLSTRSEDVLQAGMVVTVEPGIYLPGAGGVRIEDMLVITDDGCKSLTSSPK
ncbi:MAG: aminopeptidase P family protein [Actinobacteria bacterium]|nr:aminopeptidase P family protein [Actinomycetota bacterium]MCL5446221.1 aminopeptidase P family protein [Actinomycetota bacterium]